mmetsp:Transcript_19657/g.33037  ORF Transcript_19657/g.33037 Transcript_19657/m.33037 type:complete len:274 (+) Transcript_19657:290-1111(+)|eukprot:CAMPEP_0198212274 /NCGR_PEP_ID=MMETSP1445-20131203/25623_1 /TAXON_ID=36898 /ORGANISM="Pyramimonas sp., Strain CCMP2087" /LENGTH=273 /DNA_ID=CAMNT_0043886683 /DNA_START=261 /DNA_END=1082 /DNA_ORIENTATION=+
MMNQEVVPPEPELVKQMCEMGFTQNQSLRALTYTSNHGIEVAVTWLMEHLNDEDIDLPLPAITGATRWKTSGEAPTDPSADWFSHSSREAPSATGSMTSIILPPTGASVALGVPSPMSRIVVNPAGERVPALIASPDAKVVILVPMDVPMSAGKLAAQCAHAAVGHYRLASARRLDWLGAWEATGEKTIVLALDNSQMVPAIIEKAHNFLLLTHIVQDAGNTEVQPGTVTCIAIGGPVNLVDMVTGKLDTFKDTCSIARPSIRSINNIFSWGD